MRLAHQRISNPDLRKMIERHMAGRRPLRLVTLREQRNGWWLRSLAIGAVLGVMIAVTLKAIV